ncbi:hypothetical protein AA313_de0207257 [Arthrobotrys entomopaga]|nr:hypothetical protein AA313_de0207257 [Arthrobotrys entomopaga]
MRIPDFFSHSVSHLLNLPKLCVESFQLKVLRVPQAVRDCWLHAGHREGRRLTLWAVFRDSVFSLSRSIRRLEMVNRYGEYDIDSFERWNLKFYMVHSGAQPRRPVSLIHPIRPKQNLSTFA